VELTPEQYGRIAPLLPRQRGNVSLSNLQVLNAILYVAEHGCKWRGLPEHFGNWHTVYTRMNRWSKKGVLDRVFGHLQREQVIRIRIEAPGLDSTGIGCIPTVRGRQKKRRPVHRQVPGRMEHQASWGCCGCPDSRSVRALSRQRPRCPAGAAAPEAAGKAVAPSGTHHGPGLRGR